MATRAVVLYHLAACPEYQQPLRDEIQASVDAEGWTKAAVGKMWKLDSLLRESQRYNSIVLSEPSSKQDSLSNDAVYSLRICVSRDDA